MSIDGDNSEIGERGVSRLDFIDAIKFHQGIVQVNLSGGQKARGKPSQAFVSISY
jgi:hypothetical protein